MRAVFADAGYWIGMLFRRDQLHERALALTARLDPLDIVTTQMIVVEVFNHASRIGLVDREVVVDWLRDLERNDRLEIVPQTPQQFHAAAERFVARADQSWSLTDCASFLVMEEHGITEALAYDRDFEQAGFTALLRESD